MTLPAAGYISNASRTVAEQKTALEDVRDFVADLLGGAAREALTIASGAVVPGDGTSGGVIVVDTEAAAASDDLTTITTTNTPDGRLLIVYGANASRVVTVKHNAGGSGQIQLKDSADFALDALDKWVLLQLRSTTWVEIERGYGADYPGLHDHMRIAAVPAHNMLCPHTNLTIYYASASTLAITATEVVLYDSSRRQKRFASLSETLNVANTGANGRDVVDNGGAEQASAWYHLFAIGKTDGTLDVFATQACYPTGATSIYTRLPSGYTWAGYLGAWRNNSGGDLQIAYQRGTRVLHNGTTPLSGGTATSYTSIDLSDHVPETALTISGTSFCISTSGTPACNWTLAANTSNNIGSISFYSHTTSVGNGTGGPFKLDLVTAQTMAYLKSSGATNVSVLISGWEY